MADALSLRAVIGLDKTQYDMGLKQASSDMHSFGGVLSKGFGTVAKVGAAAYGVVAAATGAFVKKSIDAGMTFDSSMSQVAATMGSKSEEMVEYNGETIKSIDALRDFAKEMGRTTAFSASQSADALNYMALAGYDAKKSMEMLPNVLNLAAAGGMDLAAASDMITDAQSALGLSTEETTALVNKMAKGASSSNASVSQLGEAMLTIGGTARVLKGGTTELSAALGILADNGIKGAEGGTQLRNVLLGIQSKKFEKSFGKLGISAYDSTGKLRSMSDILADMNSVMGDMTDKQKTELISKAFNKQDLKAVNALLGTSVSRWEELSEAIEDSGGAADTMAKTQMNNLSGAMTYFRSALEGAQIAISEKLSPSLTEFVQSGTDALSTLTGAFEENGFEGMVAELPKIIEEGTKLLAEKAPKALDAAMQIFSAIGKGIYNSAPAIFNSVITIGSNLVTKLYSSISEGYPQILNTGIELIGKLATGIREKLPDMIATGLEALMQFSGTFRENFGLIFDAGLDLIKSLAESLIANIPVFIETVPTIVANIAGLINDNAPKLLEAAWELLKQLGQGLIDAIPTLLENIPQIIQAIVSVWSAFNWLDLGKNVITAISNGAKIVFSPATWKNIGNKIITSIANGVKALITNVPQLLKSIVQNGGSIIKNFGWASLGRGIITVLVEGIKALASKIPTVLKSIGSAAMRAFKSINWHSVGINIIKGIAAGISGAAGTIVNAAKDAAKSAFNAAKKFLGIESPSKLFRDKIGAMMAKGMAIGFEQEVDPEDYEDVISGLENVGKDFSAITDGAAVTVDKTDDYTGIVKAIRDLEDAVLSMQIVMDSGELVGAISDTMNLSLGRKAVIAARS